MAEGVFRAGSQHVRLHGPRSGLARSRGKSRQCAAAFVATFGIGGNVGAATCTLTAAVRGSTPTCMQREWYEPVRRSVYEGGARDHYVARLGRKPLKRYPVSETALPCTPILLCEMPAGTLYTHDQNGGTSDASQLRQRTSACNLASGGNGQAPVNDQERSTAF